MAIYTRKGDRGKTGIYGSKKRISKSDQRVWVLGSIDELNSQLGLVLSLLSDPEIRGIFEDLQEDLFEIAAEIAANKHPIKKFRFKKSKTTKIERLIDYYWPRLPKLQRFVFPGGSTTAAQIHISRALCRRVEREMVEIKVDPSILSYINRLSDLLFTLARWVNYKEGFAEKLWIGLQNKPRR